MLKIFVFIDIWFVKQNIKNDSRQRYAVLNGEFENEKKGQKNLWSSGEGIIRTPDFLIFPPMIWIYMEAKGAGIKSKQSSKVFSTLVNKSD